MIQQPGIPCSLCRRHPQTQRIAAGAGSHGAVGRGGSVRGHILPENIENFRMRQPGQIFSTLRKLIFEKNQSSESVRAGVEKIFPGAFFG